MKFWKWYLNGILGIPKALISPWGEYILSIAVTALASYMLCILVIPLWLLLVLPVGATVASHGFWRSSNKSGK